MKWHRQHNDQDLHPDILAAGYWAGAVFRCLCRVSGQYDLDGQLPGKYAAPEYVARRLGLTPGEVPGGDPVAVVARAIEAAIEVGLILRGDDGRLDLPGWPEIQGDTGAERKRRARKRAVSRDRSGSVTGQSRDPAVTVTPPSGPEEKRREERRQDERTPSSPDGELSDAPAGESDPEGERGNVLTLQPHPGGTPADDVLARAKEVLTLVAISTGRWQGRNASSNDQANLRARLREGATVQDCVLVAEHKHAEWNGHPVFDGKVQPSTLYRPGKWEGNLEAARRWKAQGRPDPLRRAPTRGPARSSAGGTTVDWDDSVFDDRGGSQ